MKALWTAWTRSVFASAIVFACTPCLCAAPPGRVVAAGIDVPADLTNAVAVAAGHHHAIALKEDGTVVAWGPNWYGETDVPPGLTGVVAIAAGSVHNLALRNDGTVVEWGFLAWGIPMPAGLNDVKAVATGEYTSFAIRSNGTVAAWDRTSEGQCFLPDGLTNVTAVAGNLYWSCALKSTGESVVWGGVGQADDFRNPPSNGVAAALGVSRGLMLKSSGEVASWGSSNATPAPPGLHHVVGISASESQYAALRADGAVLAWGSPFQGTPITNAIALAAGHTLLVAIVSDDPQLFTQWPPAILQEPEDRILPSGKSHTLSADVDASGPLFCQWYRDGIPIPGANGVTLTFADAQLSDSGSYRLVASNALGTVSSRVANITVTNMPPIITAQSPGRKVLPRDSVLLQVEADGSRPMTCQWYLNGVALDRATNFALPIEVGRSNSGLYTVAISNAFGSTTSSAIELAPPLEYTPQGNDPLIFDAPAILLRTVTPRLPPPTNYTSWGSSYWYEGACCAADVVETTVWSRLDVDAARQRVVGHRIFSSVTSIWTWGGVTWHWWRTLGTDYRTQELFAVSFPPGNNGLWRLSMAVETNDTTLTGRALLELSTGTAYPFVLGGTNGPGSLCALTLTGGIGTLSLRTFGLEAGVPWMRGNVGEQQIDHVERSTVTIGVDGAGWYTPELSGATLDVAETYTLEAVHGRNVVFSHWTVGDATVENPTLNFPMSPNLAITAHFIPRAGAFASWSGSYHGLFWETNAARAESSGSFTARVTPTGRCSGRVTLGPRSYPFNVMMNNLGGYAQATLSRPNAPLLTLDMRMDSTAEEIRGSIGNGSWTSVLFAERDATAASGGAAPASGFYSLLIAGNSGAANCSGEGHGNLRAFARGGIAVTGRLGDGASFIQSGAISRRGHYSFYAPLYARQGALLGWLTLTNDPPALGGELIWIRPDRPRSPCPDGWIISVSAAAEKLAR